METKFKRIVKYRETTADYEIKTPMDVLLLPVYSLLLFIVSLIVFLPWAYHVYTSRTETWVKIK